MTKKEIIDKWSGILAAERKDYRPLLDTTQYDSFLEDCKANGYVGECAEELWQKAVTNCDRMNFKSFTALKQVRLSKGLSQSQLAALADIGIRTLQEHEQGRRPLKSASYEVVVRIAKALGVEPEKIV